MGKKHSISGTINVGAGVSQEKVQAPVPPSPSGDPVRFAFESKFFVDQRGARVEQRILVFGAFPATFVPFVGAAAVRMETPDGTSMEEFKFPIAGATTLEEAFGRFEGALREGAEVLKKRKMAEMNSQQQRLLIPGLNAPANMRLPPAPGKKPGLVMP